MNKKKNWSLQFINKIKYSRRSEFFDNYWVSENSLVIIIKFCDFYNI